MRDHLLPADAGADRLHGVYLHGQRGDLPVERLARLMTEYLHEKGPGGQAGEFFGSRTQIARALVHDEHIPVSSRITPYEDARRIIRDSAYRAVTLCYCRHKKAHLGQACRKGAPAEGICMVLGEGARFLVRRGFAEVRSVAQMLEILEYARSLGLTHVTDNVREQPSFVCNCCRCCCELMAGVQSGFPDGLAKTPFIAQVDSQRCDYCGECLRACNVKCIGLASDAVAGQGAEPANQPDAMPRSILMSVSVAGSAPPPASAAPSPW